MDQTELKGALHSEESALDIKRRRLLTGVSAVVGGVGVAFLATPFIKSWSPSARAESAGAPVTVDISKLKLGEMITVDWRGRPVYIVNRSDDMVAQLTLVNNDDELDDDLKDPESDNSLQPERAKNGLRSFEGHEQLVVLEGVCTHLGCPPAFRPEVAPADLGEDWKGGFYCPCHNSKFDLAGRVLSGSPAATNLPVPPYGFIDEHTIVVGIEGEEA
jgi:ubiquinol-cytochrome c reductase iron-sulfur subunit